MRIVSLSPVRAHPGPLTCYVRTRCCRYVSWHQGEEGIAFTSVGRATIGLERAIARESHERGPFPAPATRSPSTMPVASCRSSSSRRSPSVAVEPTVRPVVPSSASSSSSSSSSSTSSSTSSITSTSTSPVRSTTHRQTDRSQTTNIHTIASCLSPRFPARSPRPRSLRPSAAGRGP